MPAIRAAAAGPRALRGDGQKTRVLARDLFDAAARHRTELVHAPFYGVRCVTLQTSAQTRSIHAKGGRACTGGRRRRTGTLTRRTFASGSIAVGSGIVARRSSCPEVSHVALPKRSPSPACCG